MTALARLTRLVWAQLALSGVVIVGLLWLAYFGNADLLSLDAVGFVVPAAVIAIGLFVHERGLERGSDESWDWVRQFEWGWLVFYVLAAVIIAAFSHVWWAAAVALALAVPGLFAQQLLHSPELNAWLDERAGRSGVPAPSDQAVPRPRPTPPAAGAEPSVPPRPRPAPGRPRPD